MYTVYDTNQERGKSPQLIYNHATEQILVHASLVRDCTLNANKSIAVHTKLVNQVNNYVTMFGKMKECC